MSRLVVKNLPKQITEEKLRESFSKKGQVTDVQLKYTKSGKFRHFGFVGFTSQVDAQEALHYFNNTFLNSSKIQVEFCVGLGDPNKPKAWSKYATDSSAYKKKNEPEPGKHVENPDIKNAKQNKKEKDLVVQKLLEKHKDDPLFTEFMEAHSQGNKSLWSNDVTMVKDFDNSGEKNESENDLAKSLDKIKSEEEDEDDEGKGDNNVANKEITDLEYLKIKTVKLKDVKIKCEDTLVDCIVPERKKMLKQEKIPITFFTVKVNGLTYKEKKKDVKEFFHPLKPKSIRLPQNIKGIAYVCFTTEKEMKQALAKNRSFLSGKRMLVTKYTDQVKNDEVILEKEKSKWHKQEENLKNEESIPESGRIFVRNLSYLITEEDLEGLFNKYGPTTEISMPVDRLTRKPKGFAHITYVFPEHAAKAYCDLDGTIFHGRMLHLLPGKPKASLEEAMEEDGLSFNAKKLLKLKSQSGSSHNWNSLFLGLNAVADVMATTYNTTKDNVLESQGSESIAVRLALGETQIVAQTRDFLIEGGVQLDAFNQAPQQRSKSIILVKNLPARTTSAEIIDIFQPHGELGRVILPPSGITAIVEFLEPSEARTAFTRVAYTKFKNLPLYLEWAPFDTFKMPANENETLEEKTGDAKTSSEDSNRNSQDSASTNTAEQYTDDDDLPAETETMLYVKNLNFNTNEDELKKHFSKCGKIHYVSVATKKDLNNPGQLLSMGYGFIQFKKKSSADHALKTMQKVALDGHAIEIKRSNRTLQTEVKTTHKKTEIGKQTGTKILVRNIPFQATEQEIRDLFKTFGELKAVRLPKKMTGTGPHRGFAFVEYETKHDSERAFKSLCQSTHLYGRRLVLEWAAREDNVDEIRKRTADHFFSGPSHIKTVKKGTIEPEELGEEF